MGLINYQQDMETCCRCSCCKFIPMEKIKGLENANVCPSITRYQFHGYSGGGRMGIGVAILEKELEMSDKLLEVVYNCQMCGACDISCKYAMDMEVFQPITETRITCVKNGQTLPVFDKMMDGLRNTGHMAKPGKADKNWFDGLDVKNYTREKVDVVYHAGCRTASDQSLWKIAQSTLALMQKAGVDAGIAENEELCCGGRAYYLGYKDDFLKHAEKNMQNLAKSGAKTLVTGCAECYHAFKVLYDRFHINNQMEILHTTEYFLRLIKDGKLTPSKQVDMDITYHDPCYLGRLGEPWIHWEGKLIPGQILLFDPPKEFLRGTYGVYQAPRELMGEIPGLNLVEMVRTREYAWCCGSGGGVKENNPEFAEWTANERLTEAESTGAKALVTACPGCEKNFSDVTIKNKNAIQIFDVVELLAKSIL